MVPSNLPVAKPVNVCLFCPWSWPCSFIHCISKWMMPCSTLVFMPETVRDMALSWVPVAFLGCHSLLTEFAVYTETMMWFKCRAKFGSHQSCCQLLPKCVSLYFYWKEASFYTLLTLSGLHHFLSSWSTWWEIFKSQWYLTFAYMCTVPLYFLNSYFIICPLFYYVVISVLAFKVFQIDTVCEKFC